MNRILWFVGLVMVWMCMATSGFAATSVNYTLVITITTDSIDITGPWTDGSWSALGGISVNSQKHTKDFGVPTASGNWTFNNVGSSAVDLNLSVTAPSQNGWNYLASGDPGASQPGNDQYRMSALFTQWDRATLAYTNFNTSDVLTTNAAVCSNTRFAWDVETDVNFKGHTIGTGQARNMFVLIETGPRLAATAGNITPSIQVVASAH